MIDPAVAYQPIIQEVRGVAPLVEQIVQQNDPEIVANNSDAKNDLSVVKEWALKDVEAWRAGKKELSITKENSGDYLNAAKYSDLLQRDSGQSTYPIRLKCLLSNPEELTTLEAFSYRLNPTFFKVKDEAGKFLPNKKFELYEAGENELTFVPEWQKVQKKITKLVVNTVCSLSDQLGFSEPHLILFTGTYGSGKSYQTKHHPLTKDLTFDSTSAFSGFLSSDAVKRVYMATISGTTDDQVHHEGVALRLQIMKSLLAYHNNLTLIQEAVLSNVKSIDDTIDPCIASRTKVKIIFTDTSLENSVFSILTREAGSATPSFDTIVKGESDIRKARTYLHEKIDATDAIDEYELLYRDQNGTKVVVRKENGKVTILDGYESIQTASDPETINTLRSRKITQEDVKRYGVKLEEFQGMTIEDALNKLRL